MRKVVGISLKIKRKWLDALLDRLAKTTDEADLRSFLDKQLKDELPGNEGRAKTAGIVLRIWSGVPPQRLALRDRAVAMLPRIPGQERIWLHWGMTALAYPFFRDTAEVVGRLLALQDDFTTAQVRNRIITSWGDRATSRDAAQYLLNTLVDWEVLRATKQKGQFLLARKMTASTPDLQLWLLEALLAASAADEIEAQQLLRLPEAFPFTISVGVADLRRYEGFNIHRQGLDMDMVALRKAKVEPKKPASKKAKPKKADHPNLFGLGADDPEGDEARLTAADAPFAAPIAECAASVREGRFYAGLVLSQAVVEAAVLLVWRVKVRKRKNQPADFHKALEALQASSLLDRATGTAVGVRWASRDALLRRRSEADTDRRPLEAAARSGLSLVESIAGKFFSYTQREGGVIPDHPEYWSADEAGSPVPVGG
jgi:hypothetical protein